MSIIYSVILSYYIRLYFKILSYIIENFYIQFKVSYSYIYTLFVHLRTDMFNRHVYTYIYATPIILYTSSLPELVECSPNGLGDLGSIPGCVIPKFLKMVLDTSLLNSQQYKVRVKWSNPGKGVAPSLLVGVVAIEKGAFYSPSTKVANFTHLLTYYWKILFTI